MLRPELPDLRELNPAPDRVNVAEGTEPRPEPQPGAQLPWTQVLPVETGSVSLRWSSDQVRGRLSLCQPHTASSKPCPGHQPLQDVLALPPAFLATQCPLTPPS